MRRITALVAITVCTAATVVQWSPPVVKDLSTPFPCQTRRCGCTDADACWRGCCCFSQEEKVAWAAEHDLALPDFVEDQLTYEFEVAASMPSKPSPACCLVDDSCVASAADSPQDEPVSVGQSRNCRGLTPLIVILSNCVVPEICDSGPPTLAWSPLAVTHAPGLDSHTLAPPVPPPRAVV